MGNFSFSVQQTRFEPRSAYTPRGSYTERAMDSFGDPFFGGRMGGRMGSGMGGGRKIIDDLRDVLQKRVDDLEEASVRQFDRLASRGAQELEDLRKQVSESSKRSGTRSRRRPDLRAADNLSRDAKARERSERRAVQASKRERKAERGARRRASRAADRARHRADAIRAGRRFRLRGYRGRDEETDPAAREHARLVARARRRANQRLAFITHLVTYLATLALILVATRSIRVAAMVGLSWGIGVFVHYLWAMTAPVLRDRWVEREVGAQSARGMKSERREVETRSRRSLEDLSASIAHEIRNPITAAKSLVQQMGEDPASHENIEFAETALSELDRVERSISHLLRYARDEEPRFEMLALETVAAAAVAGLQDRAAGAGVELTIDFDRPGKMRGDVEKIRRVIENLVSNALEAFEPKAPDAGGTVSSPRIEVIGGENLAATEVWLRVIDNGPGIELADRDRIWSPFFTTREAGTGLGLALSRKTIEAHGGRIELVSDGRQGTEFILSFPKGPDSDVGVGGAEHDDR